MATVSKSDIQKNPIDFLYYFVNDSFLKLVAKYISASAALTIQQKQANQKKYLTNVYGSVKERDANAPTDLTNWIQAQYGLTPQQILSKLLAGETVAGKNWKEGVFGIGTLRQSGFSQNTDLVVDPTTGTISSASGKTNLGTPVATYDKKGNITGYTYNTDGTVYTTIYDKSSKKYYANTYGTSSVMQFSDGSTYNPTNASSVWENIQTAMPWISKILEWIASLFNFSLIRAENTVPSQTEMLTFTESKSSNLATVGIVGAALIGGMLLLSDNK